MGTTLLGTSAWAEVEFGNVKLGDKRLDHRAVSLAASLADEPSGILPKAVHGLAELEAAYRFFGNGSVSYGKLLTPHWERTRRACQNPGDYLLVEDTTDLDFTSHNETEGLGSIGDGRGLGMFLHTTLALKIERWTALEEPEVSLLGLFDQKVWAREEKTPNRLEKKTERLARERESQRWAEVFDGTPGPPEGCRWTAVADREGDIYEMLECCVAKGIDYLIRANQARALSEQDGSVFDFIAAQPVLGGFELHLRARPGQSARTAKVEVRSGVTTLRGPWRPDRHPAPLRVHLVEAREVEAAGVAKPIHWVLLTSWPVESFVDALRVVKSYARRWLIEEYHKALKTGAGIEKSELSTASRLKALLGVLALVAARLLNLKLLAEAKPDEPVQVDEVGPVLLVILEAKRGKPPGGWTNRTVLVKIASLGGFLGRKGDGNPGWQTIWRGWQKLMLLIQGYNLARGCERCD